jgi:uncharacterized protein (DUF2344 family)
MAYQSLLPFMCEDSERTSDESLEHLVSTSFSTGDIKLYDSCIKKVDEYKATNNNICFATYLIKTIYQNKDDEKEEDNKSYS